VCADIAYLKALSVCADIAYLKALFGSALRARILGRLYARPGETFHVRGLAAALDAAPGTVLRELRNLESLHVVRSTRVGNLLQCGLDPSCAIGEELRLIFLKTTGAAAEIRASLDGLAGVDSAFIYGSFATGGATPASDIDLMIVGSVDERRLSPVISRCEKRLKRPINYVILPPQEVEERSGRAGDFVHEVFAGRRIQLIGTGDGQH
jgi:predicted nucleotidyltransferase